LTNCAYLADGRFEVRCAGRSTRYVLRKALRYGEMSLVGPRPPRLSESRHNGVGSQWRAGPPADPFLSQRIRDLAAPAPLHETGPHLHLADHAPPQRSQLRRLDEHGPEIH
jgi:hypothetical protein